MPFKAQIHDSRGSVVFPVLSQITYWNPRRTYWFTNPSSVWENQQSCFSNAPTTCNLLSCRRRERWSQSTVEHVVWTLRSRTVLSMCWAPVWRQTCVGKSGAGRSTWTQADRRHSNYPVIWFTLELLNCIQLGFIILWTASELIILNNTEIFQI